MTTRTNRENAGYTLIHSQDATIVSQDGLRQKHRGASLVAPGGGYSSDSFYERSFEPRKIVVK